MNHERDRAACLQVVLSQWVEPTYMAPRSRAAVQLQMERRSEACLKDFLLPQRCEELLQQLKEPGRSRAEPRDPGAGPVGHG